MNPYFARPEPGFFLVLRKRYPEACVDIVDSEQAAREGASDSAKRHPAVVYGPSVSSESQRIYYLVRWL